jgi:hypothetical protein
MSMGSSATSAEAGLAGGRRRDAEQGLRPGLHLAAGRPRPGQGRAGYYIHASESGGEPPGRWWAGAPRRSGSSPARWSSASRMTCCSASAGLPAAPHWAGRRAAAGKPLTVRPAAGRRAARHRRTQTGGRPSVSYGHPEINKAVAEMFSASKGMYGSPRITVSSRLFLSGVD